MVSEKMRQAAEISFQREVWAIGRETGSRAAPFPWKETFEMNQASDNVLWRRLQGGSRTWWTDYTPHLIALEGAGSTPVERDIWATSLCPAATWARTGIRGSRGWWECQVPGHKSECWTNWDFDDSTRRIIWEPWMNGYFTAWRGSIQSEGLNKEDKKNSVTAVESFWSQMSQWNDQSKLLQMNISFDL